MAWPAVLALGIALTLFLEMQDTSIRSERDVEFALRLPVLAMVPAIEASSAAKTAPSGHEAVEQLAAGNGSEELRRICTRNFLGFAKALSM